MAAKGKKNNNAISNEEIIAALLQHGTIKAAADAAGVGTRTIYDRMNEREFRAEYAQAKADIVRQAVFSINGKLAAAIEAVADIMTDKEVNPATRLQAAQTIINNAGKFAERLTKDETAARTEGQTGMDAILDNFF